MAPPQVDWDNIWGLNSTPQHFLTLEKYFGPLVFGHEVGCKTGFFGPAEDRYVRKFRKSTQVDLGKRGKYRKIKGKIGRGCPKNPHGHHIWCPH